jgi:hypothetical protein
MLKQYERTANRRHAHRRARSHPLVDHEIVAVTRRVAGNNLMINRSGWVAGHMEATSDCLARTASAASLSAASSSASRSVSTTRLTPWAPISASTPR